MSSTTPGPHRKAGMALVARLGEILAEQVPRGYSPTGGR